MVSTLNVNDVDALRLDLKCSFCARYLSVFPIHSNGTIGTVCGRCFKSESVQKLASSGVLLRDVAYESVAKYLEFPCSNACCGCNVSLRWDQTVEHEKICSTSTKRVVYGSGEGGVGAYGLDYPQLYSIYPIKCTLKGDGKDFYGYIVVYGIYFFVRCSWDRDNEILYCLVGHSWTMNPQHGIFHFRLDVGKDEYGKPLISKAEYDTPNMWKKFPGGRTYLHINLKDMHDLKYRWGDFISCTVTVYLQHTNEIASVEEEIQNISPMLRQITGCDEYMPNASMPSVSHDQMKQHCNDELLRALECPICLNRMGLFIFICLRGHSICATCKEKVPSCPFCSSPIKIRNSKLENIDGVFHYPCKFKPLGCKQSHSLPYFNKHVSDCSYRTIKCPYSDCLDEVCYLKVDHVIQHLYEKHPLDIFHEQDDIKIVIPPPQATYKWIIIKNVPIILCITYCPRASFVTFSCVHFPPQESQNCYMHQMYIFKYALSMIHYGNFLCKSPNSVEECNYMCKLAWKPTKRDTHISIKWFIRKIGNEIA